MNERLQKLRYSLGLNWGELAIKLGISRSMLGFIRRHEKDPSAKLTHRISELEKKSGSHSVATCQNCEMLLNRVIELEEQVLTNDRIWVAKGKAVIKLQRSLEKALKNFSKDWIDYGLDDLIKKNDKGDSE